MFLAELIFVQLQENVLNFKLDLVAGTEGAIRYIDIAKCMSLVNRKLYRQQGLWSVLGARAYAEATIGGVPQGIAFQVAIRGAPRTWVTRNALVKAFEHWKDQQQDVYDSISDSVKPKYQDFKVYLSKAHRDGTELTPTSGDQFGAEDPYHLGGANSWVHSRMVYELPDGAGAVVQAEPEMCIIGPDDSSSLKCLILEYQNSRALPHTFDPHLPTDIDDNLYTLSEDALGAQDVEVLQNMEESNNSPPYDVDEYPGNDANAKDPHCYAIGANATGATLGRFLNLNGFSAPNGVIEVQCQLDKGDPDAGEFWLQLVIGKREAY